MHYIVFDLEFNQDFSILNKDKAVPCKRTEQPCFEIIQIGAVKLDQSLITQDTFQRYIKPTIYQKVNPFITELTGITTEQLSAEESFPGVYKAFTEFIDGSDSVFCTWGMADLKELFRNLAYHKLDQSLLPKRYINLQPHASLHFNFSQKKLLKLKTTVELLSIPLLYPFHNALYDAYYTAEIFKKIDKESIRPKCYDLNKAETRTRQVKKNIDFEKLIWQFKKMYARELTAEEQNMIVLAYKMGKTGQFLK